MKRKRSINFSKSLGKLTWGNFKKYYSDGDYEKKTGKTAEETFKALGGKVPKAKVKE